MQAKLLRVLESGEIRRVGENKPAMVDVRVVCATHRNLPEMVAAGDFREDLMYRINTFEIHLPPLRERHRRHPGAGRRTCSPASAARRGAGDRRIADDALAALEVARLAGQRPRAGQRRSSTPRSSATAARSRREHLPRSFDRRQLIGAAASSPGPMTLRDLEMQAIHDALERHGGNKPKAADELGISLKTLYNKLNSVNELEKSA